MPHGISVQKKKIKKCLCYLTDRMRNAWPGSRNGFFLSIIQKNRKKIIESASFIYDLSKHRWNIYFPKSRNIHSKPPQNILRKLIRKKKMLRWLELIYGGNLFNFLFLSYKEHSIHKFQMNISIDGAEWHRIQVLFNELLFDIKKNSKTWTLAHDDDDIKPFTRVSECV